MKNNEQLNSRSLGRCFGLIAVLVALLLLFGFGAFTGNVLVASVTSATSIESDNSTLEKDERDTLELSERVTQTLMIEEVVEDGPAAKAGLQKGDKIVAVNDKAVEKIADIVEIVQTHAPDDTLVFTIQREGEATTRQIDVKLGQNEEGDALLGVVLAFKTKIEHTEEREMNSWFAKLFSKWLDNLPFDRSQVEREFNPPDFAKPPFDLDKAELPEGDFLQGAIIHKVEEESPAEAAGLQEKDLITAINGETIDSLETFHDLFGSYEVGDTIALTVKRRGEAEPLKIAATLDEKSEGNAYLGVQIGFMRRIEYREGTLSEEFNPDDFIKEGFPTPPDFPADFPAPADFPTPPDFPARPFRNLPKPPSFP